MKQEAAKKDFVKCVGNTRDATHIEQSIFVAARKMDSGYFACQWGYYRLTDGSVFMAPKTEGPYRLFQDGQQVLVSPLVFGLHLTVATLQALTIADKYAHLKELASSLVAHLKSKPDISL